METTNVYRQIAERLLAEASQDESSSLRGSTTPSRSSASTRGKLVRRQDPQVIPEFRPPILPDPTRIHPDLAAVIVEAQRDGFAWPLLVVGSVGTGKTYAGVQCLDWFGGSYHKLAELYDRLIRADQSGIPWQRSGEYGVWSSASIWLQVRSHPLVVLDEVGARHAPKNARDAKGRVTPWQEDQFQKVLDDRERLPLMCLTNLSLRDLAQVYDDRIMSRLTRGTVVEIVGEDRRRE
jgi:hypothetical protein